MLLAEGPRGDFVLDEASERPVVLLSGGVGLTPMVSMLHALAGTGRRPSLHPCLRQWRRACAARRGRGRGGLARRHDVHFCYRFPTEARHGRRRTTTARAWSSAELLQRLLPLDDYDFYLCGPPPFMQAIYGTLRGLGVPKQRIAYEFFGPATVLEAERAQPAAESPPAPQAEAGGCRRPAHHRVPPVGPHRRLGRQRGIAALLCRGPGPGAGLLLPRRRLQHLQVAPDRGRGRLFRGAARRACGGRSAAVLLEAEGFPRHRHLRLAAPHLPGKSRAASHAAGGLLPAPQIAALDQLHAQGRPHCRRFRGRPDAAGSGGLCIALPACRRSVRSWPALPAASPTPSVGRSRFAIVSPTSSSAAILAATLASMPGSVDGSSRPLPPSRSRSPACLFLLAAAARLGGLTGFISRPVLRGFAFGLAITIIIRQLPRLVGVAISRARISGLCSPQLAAALPRWNLTSLTIGVVALVALLLLRRYPAVPGAFLVLAAGVAASLGLGLPAHGVAVVGAIDLEPGWPTFPALGWSDYARLAQFTVPLVLILFAESWGTIRALALRHGDAVDAQPRARRARLRQSCQRGRAGHAGGRRLFRRLGKRGGRRQDPRDRRDRRARPCRADRLRRAARRAIAASRCWRRW